MPENDSLSHAPSSRAGKARTFYTFSEDTVPDGLDCVADYGTSVEDAEREIAKDRAETDEDPEYFDNLKLFKVTVEEIPRVHPAGGPKDAA